MMSVSCRKRRVRENERVITEFSLARREIESPCRREVKNIGRVGERGGACPRPQTKSINCKKRKGNWRRDLSKQRSKKFTRS